MILQLDPGYEIILSADSRTDRLWLKVNACRGSIGVKLSEAEIIDLVAALITARRRLKAAVTHK